MPTYIRDTRSPIPRSEKVSRVMSANKAKDTSPELRFRTALRNAGYVGYRCHLKTLPGKPDITFPKKKVAIFIHGCFWHHCSYCKDALPKHNRAFWKKKFEQNKERDQRNQNILRKAGWKVLVVRECQIKKEIRRQLERASKITGHP